MFSLNPWAWIAIALAAAGIFGAGYGCKAISAAEEKGEIKSELATATATLTGLKEQQKKLEEEKNKAVLAADRIPITVTRWQRETAAIPIGTKCEEGDAFLYSNVPIIIAHRQQEVFQ